MTHPKQNNRKGEDHLAEFAALAGSTGNAAIGKPHAVRARSSRGLAERRRRPQSPTRERTFTSQPPFLGTPSSSETFSAVQTPFPSQSFSSPETSSTSQRPSTSRTNSSLEVSSTSQTLSTTAQTFSFRNSSRPSILNEIRADPAAESDPVSGSGKREREHWDTATDSDSSDSYGWVVNGMGIEFPKVYEGEEVGRIFTKKGIMLTMFRKNKQGESDSSSIVPKSEGHSTLRDESIILENS
ncbi:uncharacterized protein PAC_00813 [Phialocephala subalpina]|uniref:Uncharacterized protein n=1 Tax=Phialocephala subalpina TaxID=576137 RepID=A0A1L7WDZ3_9HELO|nr:uncharacterized protein PAC_00813 [Phialocephala subalpina]